MAISACQSERTNKIFSKHLHMVSKPISASPYAVQSHARAEKLNPFRLFLCRSDVDVNREGARRLMSHMLVCLLSARPTNRRARL